MCCGTCLSSPQCWPGSAMIPTPTLPTTAGPTPLSWTTLEGWASLHYIFCGDFFQLYLKAPRPHFLHPLLNHLAAIIRSDMYVFDTLPSMRVKSVPQAGLYVMRLGSEDLVSLSFCAIQELKAIYIPHILQARASPCVKRVLGCELNVWV